MRAASIAAVVMLSLSFALTSCVPPATEKSLEAAAQERREKQYLPWPKAEPIEEREPKVTYDQDEFSGTQRMQVDVFDYDIIEGQKPDELFLAAAHNTDGSQSAVIGIHYKLDDWVFFDQAAANQKEYQLIVADRIVESGTGVKEILAVVLSDSDLEEFARDGLKIQISGRRGLSALSIDTKFFRAFSEGYKKLGET